MIKIFGAIPDSLLTKNMPLVKAKGKKAVGKNIKVEMKAGKPKKQAVAIALNVQKKAKSKGFSPKKYEATRKKVFRLPSNY